MKQPYSKLPFSVNILHSPVLREDLYLLEDAEGNDIGGIEYAGDIDYIEDACNNYQEAIELLKKSNIALNIYYKNSNLQKTGGKTIEDKINEFLNKIK